MTTNPSNLIATVESYISPSLPIENSTSSDPCTPALRLIPASTLTKLRDLGPAHVRDMRTLGHSKQIISRLPLTTATAQACTKINDALYVANRLSTDKLVVLALLPSSPGDGKDAAKELQRCTTKYRFVGSDVGLRRGAGGGGNLDDGSFEELWSTAEKYRVPIALQEMWPTGSELQDYQHNLPDTVLAPIVTHMHTLQAHTSLQILHLYLSSIFDRYPGPHLIICHPGAFSYRRINTPLSLIPNADKPKRSFPDVWQHNLYLTTTDIQDMGSLRPLLEQVPLDRLLYASNYPLEERHRKLMEELRENGILTREEWEKVAFGNAEVLFKLKGGSAGEAPMPGLLR